MLLFLFTNKFRKIAKQGLLINFFVKKLYMLISKLWFFFAEDFIDYLLTVKVKQNIADIVDGLSTYFSTNIIVHWSLYILIVHLLVYGWLNILFLFL